MRRLAPFLFLVSLSPVEPGLCASMPRPILDDAGKPLEVKLELPTAAGVGLSFAMPGAGHLYLGETSKGLMYAGLTLGLGASLAAAQHLYYFRNVSYVPPESVAAETLQGFAIAWLSMGILSAMDANGAIIARQLPLNETGR